MPLITATLTQPSAKPKFVVTATVRMEPLSTVLLGFA